MRALAPLLLSTLLAAPVSAQQAAQPLAIRSRLASDYVALRERPLFAPDRSPPFLEMTEPEPEIAAAPEPEPEPLPDAAPPSWELMGVVRSTRVNSAMFRAHGEEKPFSLRQGESREGWTLSEIGRFSVFLENGEGRASIRFPDHRP